ncbi:hypothetical protein [Nocardioides astragali]|uniref:Uncharacterized protein n=1 Tax=Nocardioides astragali TaxID=1776736 RepID=A0ABW2N0Q2_9ACTN|nr:hypothetical protein [Nocardioides astragali]
MSRFARALVAVIPAVLVPVLPTTAGLPSGETRKSYESALLPDAGRVPGNAMPFHLRLSNKDVLPEHVVPGGTRPHMLVDWVSVEMKYP